MKKIISLLFIGLLLCNCFIVIGTSIGIESNNELGTMDIEDFDPLVDINITVEILAIRALDKIDWNSNPDFFVKLVINDEEFTSPVWEDSMYLYDCWKVTKDVLDDVRNVNIALELWDRNTIFNRICDINGGEDLEVNLVYDISTGRWTGDDYNIGDGSGYGRVCGSGDGSIYNNERDSELWFNIYQNDYDNDGLPFWIETNIYETDPEVSNQGEDDDLDGIPIEWEHRFGFNPFIWEDHKVMDPDCDSLSNYEEFLTFDFNSDPYRQDVFLEIDFMEEGPNGENNTISYEAFEILKNPFHRRNIIFHVDAGNVNGGDLIPFDDDVTTNEAIEIYENYFIKNTSDAWRRSVFHYCMIVYFCRPAGYAFRGDITPYMGYTPGTNGIIISSNLMDTFQQKILYSRKSREYLYASSIMHEMGHNFGLRWGRPFGVDCHFGQKPWQISYWLVRNYKSIMNYRYTYFILDYSDGSHGRRDHDDWENIDLSYFERP